MTEQERAVIEAAVAYECASAAWATVDLEVDYDLGCPANRAVDETRTALMLAVMTLNKARRDIKDPKLATMKNGKPATEGTCPECGTRMYRIGAPRE